MRQRSDTQEGRRCIEVERTFDMQLTSESFRDGGVIPGEFCFAVADPQNHVKLSGNRNPQLAWTDVPNGTESFAMVVHDPDVPSKGDDVNKESREVPAS